MVVVVVVGGGVVVVVIVVGVVVVGVEERCVRRGSVKWRSGGGGRNCWGEEGAEEECSVGGVVGGV